MTRLSLIPQAALLLILIPALAACADPSAVGAGGGPTAAQQPAASNAPIPVEPDGGIGDGNGPPGELAEVPDFGVSSETDSLSVSPFASCWSAGGQGICSDGVATPNEYPITATGQLVVTFETGTLQATVAPLDPANPEAATSAEQTSLPLVEENPGIWLVPVTTLDPGTYQLSLFWAGDQGDAAAALALTIEGP